jgi:flavin reductase (DIM6/NTAB) family NADH-FMN oxidoreductase RutF
MALRKRDFPLDRVREHLETGPIVLVTSHHEGKSNIMTMGWHAMMQFSPALFGCYIWEGSRSHKAVRASGECVINVPTVDLLDQVIAIGNSHAEDGDKFAATGLTPRPAKLVKAPLIAAMVDEYSFFIWEVVKAHVAPLDQPPTVHYRGQGKFMIAGKEFDRSDQFKPEML